MIKIFWEILSSKALSRPAFRDNEGLPSSYKAKIGYGDVVIHNSGRGDGKK